MLKLFLTAILLGSTVPSWAQIYAPNDTGVSMGHLHYFVKDMEANRNFWITMGAQPVMMGDREVLKFPGVMVFLTEGESTGGTEGSVVNHVAFRVPNVLKELERLSSAGYKIEHGRAGTGKVGNVFTPEDERIELMEDMSINVKFVPDNEPYVNPTPMTVPITLHHIHFHLPDDAIQKSKEWYVKIFGAIPGKRYKTVEPPYEAADLPGVNLNLSEAHKDLAPLKDRRLNHIGFEVENLEAFCKKLEAMGIKLDRPYAKLASGLARAYLTDPWGVYIELTEGLNHL